MFLGDLIKITDEKYEVVFKHTNPSVLPKEVLAKGIVVKEIPQMEENGKDAILYCNPITKEVWYEYSDMPKTREELIEEELRNQANYSLDLDFRISKIELGL